MAGTGTLQQRGSGMLTVSGNNTAFSGAMDLGGYALTLASNNALGSGRVISTGGSLWVTSGVTLSQLTVDGPVTLMSKAYTSGDQTYNGALTFMSSGKPFIAGSQAADPNFFSESGNIRFMSTVSAGMGSKAAQRSFVVSAPQGTVLINDQVGRALVDKLATTYQTIKFDDYSLFNLTDVSPYSLDISAQTIRLYGDVTTFENQQYRGPVLVGDNGTNGFIRLLVSVDPSITFASTVDGAESGKHSLILRAINLPNQAGTPSIAVGDVGKTNPLDRLDILVGAQWTDPAALVADISPLRTDYVGSIDITGSIKTLNDQTYVGRRIVIGDDLTLRSELGSIEMVTGLDPITGNSTPIDGLDKTTFSLGSPDKDLGAGLARQAIEQDVSLRINRDPYVPPKQDPGSTPEPTPGPTPEPTPELPSTPGTSTSTLQAAGTNQAVDSGDSASSNRLLVSSASSVMGNYASAMSSASNTERQLELQEAAEQGDVSVGELTDLQCARDEIQDEDCKTDLPGKRQE